MDLTQQNTDPNGSGAVSEADFYKFLKEQAQQAIQEAAREQARGQKADAPNPLVPMAPPASTTAAPIKINVFGQEQQFDSPEALSKQIEQLVAQYQAVAAGQNVIQAAAPPPAEPPAIDMDEFVSKIQKDPVDAFNYAIKTRYGFDLDAMQESLVKARAIEGALIAMQFKHVQPEFEPSDNNAMILEQVRRRVGAPYTVEGLQYAFHMAKQHGLLRAAEPDRQDEQPERRLPVAPPSFSASRSAPQSTDELIDLVEQMDTNTAEAFVKKYFQNAR